MSTPRPTFRTTTALVLALLLLIAAPARFAEAQEPAEPEMSTSQPADVGAGLPDADSIGDLEDDTAVDQDAVDAENRRMTIIVGGLVFVAFAILLLTIRYWIVTRPRAESNDAGRSRSERRRTGRRSRRAIAGADHAGADDDWEPRTTGETWIVPGPDDLERERPSRASRSQLFTRDS